MQWRFGSSLDGSAKRASIDKATLIWNEVDSHFYFAVNTGATNHVGQKQIQPQAGVYPPAGALHTMNGNHIVDADIHFNTYLTSWNNTVSSCPNDKSYDTLGIAVHEFGHALGLTHPKDVEPKPSMVEGHFPKCWARSLYVADKNGLRAIYDNSPGD